jgi:hypothetical protein
MVRLLGFIAFCACLTFGCSGLGALAAPEPTKRPVALSDLAGIWEYELDRAKGTKATVDLRADGTFTIEGSTCFSGSGKWSIDRSLLRFSFASGTGKSCGVTVPGWYIYDREDHGYGIIGGERDPDGWPVWLRR